MNKLYVFHNVNSFGIKVLGIVSPSLEDAISMGHKIEWSIWAGDLVWDGMVQEDVEIGVKFNIDHYIEDNNV